MQGRLSELEAVHRLTADFYAGIAETYGLKFFHIRYLTEICEAPGRQQDSFVRRGNLNKSSIARHFSFLEENGFIQRRPMESDRRALQVFPTEKALHIMPVIQRAMEQWERTLLCGVSEAENRALAEILAKITRNAEAYFVSEGAE